MRGPSRWGRRRISGLKRRHQQLGCRARLTKGKIRKGWATSNRASHHCSGSMEYQRRLDQISHGRLTGPYAFISEPTRRAAMDFRLQMAELSL